MPSRGNGLVNGKTTFCGLVVTEMGVGCYCASGLLAHEFPTTARGTRREVSGEGGDKGVDLAWIPQHRPKISLA